MDTAIFGFTDCDLVTSIKGKKGNAKIVICTTTTYVTETEWYADDEHTQQLDSTFDYRWETVCTYENQQSNCNNCDSSGGGSSDPEGGGGLSGTPSGNVTDPCADGYTGDVACLDREHPWHKKICANDIPLYGGQHGLRIFKLYFTAFSWKNRFLDTFGFPYWSIQFLFEIPEQTSAYGLSISINMTREALANSLNRLHEEVYDEWHWLGPGPTSDEHEDFYKARMQDYIREELAEMLIDNISTPSSARPSNWLEIVIDLQNERDWVLGGARAIWQTPSSIISAYPEIPLEGIDRNCE